MTPAKLAGEPGMFLECPKASAAAADAAVVTR